MRRDALRQLPKPVGLTKFPSPLLSSPEVTSPAPDSVATHVPHHHRPIGLKFGLLLTFLCVTVLAGTAYVGAYVWWFRPKVEVLRTTSAGPPEWTYDLFAPAVWLDLQRQTRKTGRYLSATWEGTVWSGTGWPQPLGEVSLVRFDWSGSPGLPEGAPIQCEMVEAPLPVPEPEYRLAPPKVHLDNRSVRQHSVGESLRQDVSQNAPGLLKMIRLEAETPGDLPGSLVYRYLDLYPWPKGTKAPYPAHFLSSRRDADDDHAAYAKAKNENQDRLVVISWTGANNGRSRQNVREWILILSRAKAN